MSAADQLAIDRLHYDYVAALDDPRGPQPDAVRRCFTENARFVGGVVAVVREGRDAIADLFAHQPAGASVFDSPTHHFLSNLRVDVAEGEQEATSTAYLLMFGQPTRTEGLPDKAPIMRTSRYANTCRKVDGHWLFSEMVITYQYGQSIPE